MSQWSRDLYQSVSSCLCILGPMYLKRWPIDLFPIGSELYAPLNDQFQNDCFRLECQKF